MGRYYRTSSATPLDYMYKIDAPLMERAVSAQSGFIDQTLADDAWVGQNAHFKYNPKDAEQASKIIKGYADQTESIASEIMRDPVNYRKQQGAISGLKKKLIEDTTSGAIAAYSGNYAQKQAETAALAKQVELYTKSGGRDKQGNPVGISPENAAKYQQYWDENYKSTDYDPLNPMKYNRYAPSVAMQDINIKKRLGEGIEKMKANGSLVTRTTLEGREQYLNKHTDKYEDLTPERILNLVSENYAGDQQLQQYIRERSNIGALSGMVYQEDVKDPKTGSVLHRQGDIITPYSIDPRNPNDKDNITADERHNIELAQMDINKIKNPALKKLRQETLDNHVANLKVRTSLNWNRESGLAPIFKSLIDEHAFSKEEHVDDMKANPIWINQNTQANENARNAARIAQQEKQSKRVAERMDAALNQKIAEFDWKKDQDVYNREHPKGTGTKGPGGVGSGGTAPAYKAPEVTGVGDITTYSFAGTTTKDANNNTVPMLSSAGIAADLGRAKGELQDIDNQIAAKKQIVNTSGDEIARAAARTSIALLELKRKEPAKTVELRRDWFTKASNIVLNDDPMIGAPMSKEDKALYMEFGKDMQGKQFKENIKELEKKYPQVRQERSGSNIYYMVDSPQVQAAREKLAKYYEVAAQFTKKRDLVYKEMNNEYLNTNAIMPTEKESVDMWSEIERNTNNVQVFNQRGEKTAENILSTDSKWWPGIFSVPGALRGIGAIGKSTEKTGGDFSTGLGAYIKANDVKVHITRLGASTKMGNGNGVVEVQFEDPKGKLSNQPFFMVLSPELTTTFANKFSNHRDPRVAKIASDIGNSAYRDIRNQITQPKINAIIGNKDTEQTFDVLLPTRGGNKMVVQVHRFPDSERLFVTQVKDKKTVPFEVEGISNSSGAAGDFAHVDDFLDYYSKADAPIK